MIGRTDAVAEAPILWPPDVKSWLTLKDPDAAENWGQEEKGTAEDERVGRHQKLSGHEFEQAPGDSEGRGSLARCSPWGRRESDTTKRLNNSSITKAAMANFGRPPHDNREVEGEIGSGDNGQRWVLSKLGTVGTTNQDGNRDWETASSRASTKPAPPVSEPHSHWAERQKRQLDGSRSPETHRRCSLKCATSKSSSNKLGSYWVDKPILSVSGWKCKVWLAIKVPFKPLGLALLLENVVPTKQREKRGGASYPYGASSKGLCLRPYICSNKCSLTLPVLSSFYKQGNEALKILSILLKVI